MQNGKILKICYFFKKNIMLVSIMIQMGGGGVFVFCSFAYIKYDVCFFIFPLCLLGFFIYRRGPSRPTAVNRLRTYLHIPKDTSIHILYIYAYMHTNIHIHMHSVHIYKHTHIYIPTHRSYILYHEKEK